MAIEKLMLASVSNLTTLASQDKHETSKTVAKNNYDIPVVKNTCSAEGLDCFPPPLLLDLLPVLLLLAAILEGCCREGPRCWMFTSVPARNSAIVEKQPITLCNKVKNSLYGYL